MSRPVVFWPLFSVTSTFTPHSGPKGVINDWRRFKQLETEQREEQCREMERLVKKLSMTCRSHLDEEEERHKQEALQEKLGAKVISSPPCHAPGFSQYGHWHPVGMVGMHLLF